MKKLSILLPFFCGLLCLQPARAQFIPGGIFERNQGSFIKSSPLM